MTPTEQRIAIAKYRVWTLIDPRILTGYSDDPRNANYPLRESLPAYDTSLDALHEVELSLTEKVQQAAYSEELIQVLNRAMDGQFRFLGASPYHVATAAPAHRLEALCRTLGLWVEPNP